MDKSEISETINDHALWIESDGKEGRRADLRYKDLSHIDLSQRDLREATLYCADLRGTDLRYADLRGVNFRRANLSCADLRGATFQSADLRFTKLIGTDLRGADLHRTNLEDVTGFILLPVQDTRGYAFAHAIDCPDGWRVRAGCRDFSIAEAREHWGKGYEGNREQGDMYLAAIDWLERELEHQQS